MKNVFNAFVEISSISDCWSLSTDSLRRQDGNKAFLYCFSEWLQIQKPWALLQQSMWARLVSQKACNPSQIASVELQESISFPQQYHGLAKWSSLLVLFSSRLSLVHRCIFCLYFWPLTIALSIWSQGVGRHRCHSAQSRTSAAFFCMLVLFFLFSSCVKLPVLSTGS